MFREVWNEIIIIILVKLLDQDLVNFLTIKKKCKSRPIMTVKFVGLIKLLFLNKYTGVSKLT